MKSFKMRKYIFMCKCKDYLFPAMMFFTLFLGPLAMYLDTL